MTWFGNHKDHKGIWKTLAMCRVLSITELMEVKAERTYDWGKGRESQASKRSVY